MNTNIPAIVLLSVLSENIWTKYFPLSDTHRRHGSNQSQELLQGTHKWTRPSLGQDINGHADVTNANTFSTVDMWMI